MKTKTKVRIVIVVLVLVAIAALVIWLRTGTMQNKFDNVKGKLVGHSFNVEAFDSDGEETLSVSGRSVTMAGNKDAKDSDDMNSVITITVDGDEIESCGDTVIFAEKGLKKEVDFSTELNSTSNGLSTIDYKINKYANKFGKGRIVIIKSQLGKPLAAYSGNKVYWETVEDLPKTTKLMIDGDALYIHRANFQIIDKDLLSE